MADLFRAALPDGTPIIHQPPSVAQALGDYVARHPDYDIGSAGRRAFFTTGAPKSQSQLIEAFWGAPLTFEAAGGAPKSMTA